MKILSLAQLISLKNKTAIVTGGAMGIGFGVARRLAEAGANVVIADIDGEVGKAAAKELKNESWQAAFVKTDVSREQDIQAAVDFTVKTYGGIDILVNNAGIYPTIPIRQMKPADFEKVLAVNLKSVFLSTKAAAEQMIQQKRGGKIINITSIDALHPSSVGLAVYDASKHGVWGFTKNTALEFAPHNIQINAIAPGGIATPGTGAGKAIPPAMEAIIKKFIQKIPMKRMGDPDDIGKVALFLASDLSSYMTGSQVVVDGGVLLS
ncbi:MAG: SDR family oxidoreductase [Candidatus Kerfeldbacteria bacterium RIFCSPHIGHO2_12_FULL_48_17]|uniref:SDR family oxidoreductase n=1 Tax=Candidatus Kerfeldbacteria bacterium RIFCSPHIGHO2_12_FULL_48_17 TaxID=1798542 RepID=A0A1G2B720_9BACT|nr:MAG: SDR family oxidoreductase [Candidatus Kerfeldbacteria bacterium RIFCSPHIGHO2_12_FULL_48_17]